MRIALITDSHFGEKSDSALFLDYQQRFFDKVFFPYLKRHKIDTVFHLGDLVHRRKYINFNTLNRMRQMFLDKLDGYTVHMILGNHDTFLKNTNKINSLRELVVNRYKFTVHELPIDVEIGGTSILMLPWIAPDIRAKTTKAIKSSRSGICFGHLELSGFLNNEGIELEHADKPESFDKFDVVCSGHYHTLAAKENIQYLGAPFQFTWNDYNTPKGFWVFDTETRKLQFIQNESNLFVKLYYNDSKYTLDQMNEKAEISGIESAYCKIEVDEKTNPYTFDQFLAHVERLGPLDLKVIEKQHIVWLDDVDSAEDTLTTLKKSADALEDVNVDKSKLKSLLTELHNETSQMVEI